MRRPWPSDADGKIVVAGWSVMREHQLLARDFALARYNTDGSLDTQLRRRRQGDHRLRFVGDYGLGVSVGAAGKIVVVGHAKGPAMAETLPWCATTPMAAWTPALAATAR